jgi:hypothetical protein
MDNDIEQKFFLLLDYLISRAPKKLKELKIQIFIQQAREDGSYLQEFETELRGLI